MAQQQQKKQKQIVVDWDDVLRAAGAYPMDAVNFVREGLSFTVRKVHRDPESMAELDRHVSGQQLCIGLRDFAIRQFGLLAPSVLRHWNIHRTDDFGRIVFAMIECGVMSKTADDTIEDFRGVYDFGEAFSRGELVNRIGCGDE
jgi:uncharacterized repeat protein (TIGR04138 family)